MRYHSEEYVKGGNIDELLKRIKTFEPEDRLLVLRALEEQERAMSRMRSQTAARAYDMLVISFVIGGLVGALVWVAIYAIVR